jgi:hypothetical protein
LLEDPSTDLQIVVTVKLAVGKQIIKKRQNPNTSEIGLSLSTKFTNHLALFFYNKSANNHHDFLAEQRGPMITHKVYE